MGNAIKVAVEYEVLDPRTTPAGVYRLVMALDCWGWSILKVLRTSQNQSACPFDQMFHSPSLVQTRSQFAALLLHLRRSCLLHPIVRSPLAHRLARKS